MYARPADLTPSEEIEQLRRELHRLRDEVERLQRRDRGYEALLKLANKLYEAEKKPKKGP